MKLRIFTSMLMVVFLSLFNTSNANAHGGCNTGNSCHRGHGHWGHGCWGHNAYIYGPDGCYAKHKACCEKKCESKCEKKCESKCTKSTSCCKSACHHTYRRARYAEDCCGWGHLHCVTSDCKKKCSKDNDDDDDN